jgi:hypothetical protein
MNRSNEEIQKVLVGALYLAISNLLRISSSISFWVMTINSQGWLLHAVVADQTWQLSTKELLFPDLLVQQ